MRSYRSLASIIFVISFLFTVAGCGGGGDGGGSIDQANINEGVWEGTYTSSSGSLQFPATALITTDGSVGIDIGNGVVFYGQLDSDNTITGSENISPNAIVIMSGNINDSGQLVADIAQGAQALSAGATFALSYNDLYERPSSLSNLVGTWSGNNTIMTGGSGSPQDWSITFQSDGTFDGSSSGINISGNTSLVDATKNEYAISMTLSHDTINYSLLGDYQGFAFLTDSSAMNDTLVIFIKRSGANSYLGALTLQ
jgi:hypothetical protein